MCCLYDTIAILKWTFSNFYMMQEQTISLEIIYFVIEMALVSCDKAFLYFETVYICAKDFDIKLQRRLIFFHFNDRGGVVYPTSLSTCYCT